MQRKRKKFQWRGILFIGIILFFLTSCGIPKKTIPQTNSERWKNDDVTIQVYQYTDEKIISMPLKEYLYGVVAGEMDNQWPKEALAAQAIMARTFTLEKIMQGGVPEHRADASTDIREFQAYDATKINENVKRAVDDTANMVATYQGDLIKAWFFADGGGRTAASAWEGLAYNKEETPYIKSVKDPGFELNENPNRSWETYFSMQEVTDAIKQVTGIERERFDQVQIKEQGISGRVITYQFDDIQVGAAAFRLALGGETMKSNLVEKIQIQDGQLRIEGKGYGHGVGMSQWGAKALAKKGWSAEEIVSYFFNNVEIKEIRG